MISLQFAAQDNLGNDLILWYAHGMYAHVDAILQDGKLLGARSNVIGVIPAGVQIRPPGYANFVRTLQVHLAVDQAVEDGFYSFLYKQIGKPYDEPAIVSFLTGRDWRNPDAWMCSELMGATLEACGFFPYRLATPTNKLTPDDCLLAISARAMVG